MFSLSLFLVPFRLLSMGVLASALEDKGVRVLEMMEDGSEW